MPEPEEVYDQNVYDLLRDAGLAHREAQAIALRAEGLTYAEAADVMGITPGNFGSKMSTEIKSKVQEALKLTVLYDEYEAAFPKIDEDPRE